MIKSAELIAAAQPKAFVLENVRGIEWHASGHYLKKTLRIFQSANLDCEAIPIECSRLGVPQRRKRILIVGGTPKYGPHVIANVTRIANHSECEISVGDVLEPAPLEGTLPNHTVASFPAWYSQVLTQINPGQKLCDTRFGPSAVHSWDVPEVFGSTTSVERELLTYIARARRRSTGRRYDSIGDGRAVNCSQLARGLNWHISNVRDNVSRLVASGFLRRYSGDYVDLARKFNGRFKRLPLEGPAPAVLRQVLLAAEHRSSNAKSWPNRTRECARLQGFPDDFEFLGSSAHQYQLVANAFPPPVARHIAHAVVTALRSNK